MLRRGTPYGVFLWKEEKKKKGIFLFPTKWPSDHLSKSPKGPRREGEEAFRNVPFSSVWRFSSWGREGRPLSTLPRYHTWSGDVGILQRPLGTVYIALEYVLSCSFAHVLPSGASSRDRRRRRRDATRERESPATHEGKAPFPYQ